MEKIRNLKQLTAQKKQLSLRQTELGKSIRSNLIDIKRSLQPCTNKDAFQANKENSEIKKSFIRDVFSSVAILLIHKLAGNATSKVHEWFNKNSEQKIK